MHAAFAVLARGKTDTGRARVYVRDDAPLGGVAMSLSLLKFVGQASLVDDAMLPS